MTSVLEFSNLSRASGGRLTLTFLSFEAWPVRSIGLRSWSTGSEGKESLIKSLAKWHVEIVLCDFREVMLKWRLVLK